MCLLPIPILFFFNDTATTEIYTLSLHDALPIYVYRAALSQLGRGVLVVHGLQDRVIPLAHARQVAEGLGVARSEEHTSELQSHLNLVCRLLLEKKKNNNAHDSMRLVATCSTAAA